MHPKHYGVEQGCYIIEEELHYLIFADDIVLITDTLVTSRNMIHDLQNGQ